MAEWQDIETAPKDGTFLVWLEEPHEAMGSSVGIMCNHPNVRFINGMFDFDVGNPTHWQPLPDPPGLTAGQERRE